MNGSPKSAAVCRAEWRVERSRCTVRMTVRGSVTPGMACGSRPVKGNPQLGAFPAVGIRQGPGLPRGQIGVWTGLIIPAPIWREGRDSPSGLRSHGWRSEAFSPLARPRQAAGWQIAIADNGRHGPTRICHHRNRPEQTPPLPSP
jgi:hypothetical protein